MKHFVKLVTDTAFMTALSVQNLSHMKGVLKMLVCWRVCTVNLENFCTIVSGVRHLDGPNINNMVKTL